MAGFLRLDDLSNRTRGLGGRSFGVSWSVLRAGRGQLFWVGSGPAPQKRPTLEAMRTMGGAAQHVSPAALVCLTALRSLPRTQGAVTMHTGACQCGAGCAALAGLPQVQLSVVMVGTASGPRVTAEDTAALATLSTLRALSLFNGDVGTAAASQLAGLARLMRLDLVKCAVSASSVHALGALPRLSRLNVSVNQLDAPAWHAQRQLACIQTLNASHTGLTVAGVAGIA